MQTENLIDIRLFFGRRSAETRRTEINQPANAAFQVIASTYAMRDSVKIMLVGSDIKQCTDRELHPPEYLSHRNAGDGLGQGASVALDEGIKFLRHFIKHKRLRISQIAADET